MILLFLRDLFEQGCLNSPVMYNNTSQDALENREQLFHYQQKW